MKNKYKLSALLALALIGGPAAYGQWTAQSSGTTNELRAVTFVNNTIGWAVGANGTVLSTTNGGSTWTAGTSGTTENLFSADFINANDGWIVGQNGVILKTANGGASFTAQTAPDANHFRAVDFSDASKGIAVGFDSGIGFGYMITTSNGGTTWSEPTYSTSDVLFTAASPSSTTILAAGNFGSVQRSTDGGTTWTLSTLGTTSASIRGLSFVDATNGWLAGAQGIIFKSTDGGNIWTSQTSSVTTTINDIYFVDQNKGWAVGDGGVILSTTNGGSTWTAQTSGTTANLYSIHMADANNGWIVGSNGTILRMGATAINASELSNAFRIYPNPSSGGHVTLTFDSAVTHDVTVTIKDQLGRDVLAQSVPASAAGKEIRLPVNGVAAGVYMVMISSGDAVSASKLIIE